MTMDNNMDSDEGSKQKKTSSAIVDDSDVLPPTRVRCSILHAPKSDGFLSSYYFIFLPIISIFLWSLFLLVGG
jgi:hypothetical protein